MSIKVLVVGSSIKDRGGIVTVINNIQNTINKSEFELKLVPTYLSGSMPTRLYYFIKGLFLYLCQMIIWRPNVVHIHMSYKGSFYRKSIFILLSKCMRVKTIVHIHGSTFKDFYKGLSPWKKKYCSFILNKSDSLIVLSKEWKKFFGDIIDPKKIVVLYNAVEAPINNDEMSRKVSSVPKVLFLGRLGKRKGVYDLLNAIQILSKENIQGKFILAGDGERVSVDKFIHENNLQRYVETTGWIDQKEKVKLLKECHILTLPSYNEGLPMSILEGMSYGLPIVSTPVGGIPEAVKHGENGFLVQPGDTQSLSDYLKVLLTNSEKRYKMGVNNVKAIEEKFDLNVVIKQLEFLYR